VPTLQTILKIAALAGDERAHPMVRAVAYEKLAALKDAYPHLFVLPGVDGCRDDGVRERPADVDRRSRRAGCRGCASAAAAGAIRQQGVVHEHQKWDVSAKGNPTILVMAKGVERRVVLFRYKQAPNEWGRHSQSDDTHPKSPRMKERGRLYA
jgi:hypothetical protein